MDPIFDQLIQGGAMGLFAAFLIWQHIGMQKRLDALVNRFQEQLDKINQDYDERIEKMRERYDVVIKEIRAEQGAAAKEWARARTAVQEQVITKLDQVIIELKSKQ